MEFRGHKRHGSDILLGVTFGSGIFVAVGETGSVYTSANGINWTPRTSGTSLDLFGVTYGQGAFVAVGAPDPNNGNLAAVLTSADGQTWVPAASGTVYALRGVTFGMGNFVAVGDHGTILVSRGRPELDATYFRHHFQPPGGYIRKQWFYSRG